MKVFAALFSDWTGILVIGVIVFMLLMMAFLFTMFVRKMNNKE